MNRPKRGRAPIKKSTNKKYNTLRKTIQKVKGKKKSRKRTKHKRNWDLEIAQLNHPGSINIYILWESKTRRKGDREATVRRERGWHEIGVKPQNRRWGRGRNKI